MFYLIQPWQQDPRRKDEHAGQTLWAHSTVAEADAVLDRLVDRLKAGRLPESGGSAQAGAGDVVAEGEEP